MRVTLVRARSFEMSQVSQSLADKQWGKGMRNESASWCIFCCHTESQSWKAKWLHFSSQSTFRPLPTTAVSREGHVLYKQLK